MASKGGANVTKTTTKKVSGSSSSKSSSETSGSAAAVNGGGSSSSSSVTKITTARVPITSSKTIVINRSRPSTSIDSVDSVSVRRVATTSSSLSSSVQQGVHDVSSMLSGRQQEKQQMQELNERLASYIEKVRFLEAQNKKQSAELQKLRDSWGKETEQVKITYEIEIEQLRKLLAEADSYKANAEVRITSLEEQVNELQLLLDEANKQHEADRESIEKLISQMAEYDGEISLLRRRATSFDEERSRDQAEIRRLKQDVVRLRADLDAETLNHINAENEAQSLREQLEFLKSVHESELRELAALAYRDTTKENREFWKSEMSSALREIQQEFESKLDTVRSEVESQYSIKMQEVRTSSKKDNMELVHLKEENKRIKSQIGDSRSKIPELEARNAQLERELEELRQSLEEAQRESEMVQGRLRADLSATNSTLEEYLREMQSLMDAKLSLELEIHAYRKLLDFEETRITQTSESGEQISSSSSSVTRTVSGKKQQIEQSQQSQQQIEQSQQSQITQQTKTVTSEMTAKTSNQRSAKGNVTIQEFAEDASYILLEFTAAKGKEDMSFWAIKQQADNEPEIIFILPEKTILDSADNKSLKIYAKGLKPEDDSSKNSIEAAVDGWAVGTSVVTKLVNADGDERASLIQKTTYSQD